MIASRTIWAILQEHMPRKQWVSSGDIYAIVETHGRLDDEDRRPPSPLWKTPKWKILVRDVLLDWLREGRIRKRKRTDRSGV